MDKKSLRITALIAILVGAANAGASLPTSDDVESAQIVAELIQAGKLKVDSKTGKIILNTSVLEILQDAGVVKNLQPNEVHASGGGNSTTGGGC